MTSYREPLPFQGEPVLPVLLDRLAAAQIDLVEWEQQLLRRLNVPLVADGVSSLFFLERCSFF